VHLRHRLRRRGAGRPTLPALIHDIALLHGLGIRLVLVHGARPQIERAYRS
jgi:acetylglutamate kinase